MPTLTKIELYEHIWPRSWQLETTKKKIVDVEYRSSTITCKYKDAKKPFFTKTLTPPTPYKLSTIDMLTHTGFKCGQA